VKQINSPRPVKGFVGHWPNTVAPGFHQLHTLCKRPIEFGAGYPKLLKLRIGNRRQIILTDFYVTVIGSKS